MNEHAKNLLDSLQFRFACRDFDPSRQIPDQDFQTILEAGRLSPSSLGLEPWQFLVVQNPEIREKIRAYSWGAQQQIPGLSHLLMIYTRKPASMSPYSPYVTQTIMKDVQHMSDEAIAQRSEKYKDFLDNDFTLTGNDRAIFEWGCRQCYLAMESMILMAAALKADSCPIEGFHKENLESMLEKEGLLDRSSFGVACMIAFGYRKENPTREKTRRSMDMVTKWIK